MNCWINLSDFMSYAAFLANSGWLNITSQLILPKAAFFFQPPHVLFLSPVCVLHSISTCLSGCSPRLHEHSGESNLGIFLECKNFLRSVFPSSSILPRGASCFEKTLVYFWRLLCRFWADRMQFSTGLFTWPGLLPTLKGLLL